MARVTVLVPGQPEQVLELGEKPLLIGRGEDCDLQILEVKASRRHLRLRRHENGTWVAEDLGSSNGTWFGEQRLLRRALRRGDELRIGDTTLRFSDESTGSASAPLVVGGILNLEAVTDGGSSAAAEPDGSAGRGRLEDAREVHEQGAGRAAGTRLTAHVTAGRGSLARALALVGVAALALVAVELWLGGQAARQATRAQSNVAAREVLRHYRAALEEPEGPAAGAFESALSAYRARHPHGTERLRLDGYAEEFQAVRTHRREIAARFEALGKRWETEPASVLRLEYLALARALPGDAAFGQRVRGALSELDRRRGSEDAQVLTELQGRVLGALEAGLPSLALRWIDSFERVRPGVGGAVAEAVAALRARADRALSELAAVGTASAEPTADPLERRTKLARIWPGLEGSRAGREVEEELRAMRRLDGANRGPAQTPEPGAEPTPAAAPTLDILARAQKAEEWLAARQWSSARAAFTSLVAEVPEGVLRAEWQARVEELDAVLQLVAALQERAASEKKPRLKLSIGSRTVVEAGVDGVTLAEGGASSATPWGEFPPADLLLLLAPARLTPESRLQLATLAAQIGERGAFLQALLPLYEKKDATAIAQADRLVARALFGRSEVPDGGYSAFKGELLDRAALERAERAEQAELLRGRAQELLAAVEKLPAFQKLRRLEEIRDELDRRRSYALLAIFDTVHYPYPVNKNSPQYFAVQEEVDKRVAAVREIWEKEAYKVRVEREGRLAKILEEWDATLTALRGLQVDTSALAAGMERYTQYVAEQAWDVRTWFRDKEERDLMAYNRWIMDVYNPVRTEVASGPELNQIAITNAYRMMLGFTAVVDASAAPFESISKDNVVQILDAGKVVRIVPLRAVRVDNRLCEAARAHSLDMTARGYFAHEAPPNPKTGEGPTAPHDRMRRAGYHGYGFSENIAGAGDPMTAHVRWCHSSGHHRNILSVWIDLGVGFAGNSWTQNFGGGGGGPPEIQPDTGVREKNGRAGAGQDPQGGR